MPEMSPHDRLEYMRWKYAGGPLPSRLRRKRARHMATSGCAIVVARLFWWGVVIAMLALALRWAVG